MIVHDNIVLGAGISGLSAAATLRHGGYEVLVLEKAAVSAGVRPPGVGTKCQSTTVRNFSPRGPTHSAPKSPPGRNWGFVTSGAAVSTNVTMGSCRLRMRGIIRAMLAAWVCQPWDPRWPKPTG